MPGTAVVPPPTRANTRSPHAARLSLTTPHANSHVVPALSCRFHLARLQRAPSVAIWGTGTPLREFLHVDSMAAASVHVMELDAETHAAHTQPMLSHINVGSGEEITIAELARTIARVVGFVGEITFDSSKPDGTPRKRMDSGRLRGLGWRSEVALEAGLAQAYADAVQRDLLPAAEAGS